MWKRGPQMRSYGTGDRKAAIKDYSKIVEKVIADGWNAFLITITFRQLPGTEAAIRRQMLEEAERVIWWISRAMVRNPWSESGHEKLPKVIYSLDWPVPKKYKKLATQLINVNDGIHVQGIFLKPKKTGIKQGVRSYVRENHGHLRGQLGKVDRIHLKRIDRTPWKATRYILKSYQRGYIDDDGIELLPKSLSEMRCRNKKS